MVVEYPLLYEKLFAKIYFKNASTKVLVAETYNYYHNFRLHYE
jgi:hypothetical protein